MEMLDSKSTAIAQRKFDKGAIYVSTIYRKNGINGSKSLTMHSKWIACPLPFTICWGLQRNKDSFDNEDAGQGQSMVQNFDNSGSAPIKLLKSTWKTQIIRETDSPLRLSSSSVPATRTKKVQNLLS